MRKPVQLFHTRAEVVYCVCSTNGRIYHQNTSKKNVFLKVAQGIRPNSRGKIVISRPALD